MQLLASTVALAASPSIVGWTIFRRPAIAPRPLMTVLSPHRHIAQSEACAAFGGTSDSYDYRPIHVDELPRDVGWRHLRAAPSELIRGDVVHLDGTRLTITQSVRHDGGHLLLGRTPAETAVCVYCEWNERTPRARRTRARGVTLDGARINVHRDGEVFGGFVVAVGAGHSHLVVREVIDAGRYEVVVPRREGWVVVAGPYPDIEEARRRGRQWSVQ